MNTVDQIFTEKKGFRKVLIAAAIVLIIYFMRKMMNLILLTFIITYLIDKLHSVIMKGINKFFTINEKLVTILIYILIFSSLGVAIYNFVPRAIGEGVEIAGGIKLLVANPERYGQMNGEFAGQLAGVVEGIRNNKVLYNYVQGLTGSIVHYITTAGRWSLDVLTALLLSFFFMIDKRRISAFMGRVRKSSLASVCGEIAKFYSIFLYSFGKVLEAQIVIAVVNTLLTAVGLIILNFPGKFFLTVMVFALSLIPFMGVIISLVPLVFIAFKIGGFMEVLYITAMVLVIHAIGSYVIYPKLISNRTELPIFITLLILFISEHLLGPWGLIFGLPIFMFILELTKVNKNEGLHMDEQAEKIDA